MPEHTDGPWTYEILEGKDDLPGEGTTVYIGPLDEETRKIVQTIFEGGMTHGPDDGDPVADVRLMATAPELFEALRKAEAHLSLLYFRGGLKYPDGNTGVSSKNEIGQVISEARATLAKASGRARW